MNSNEIKTGQQYWIKPTAEDPPRPLIVWRISNPEKPIFQCMDQTGKTCLVREDAFIRPVERELATS